MTSALADRFEAVVDHYGALPAIETVDRVISFDALEARANQVAAWLTSLGLVAGDRVGLALWNRPEHIELLLGTFKAGMIPVNVNCRYTAGEIEALLVDAAVRVVVHEVTLSLDVSDASAEQDWLRVPLDSGYDALLSSHSTDRPRVTRSGEDRYILYTGGSTGAPKGVVWQQDDLFDATMSGVESRRPGSRMLPASPLTHGTAQWISLSTLLSAGTVVLGPLHGLNPISLWTRVAEAQVTRLVIVGDAFARPLLDALDAHPCRWDLTSLVTITSGGARWSVATQEGLLTHLPHVAMVNSFGATETGGQGSQVRFAGQPSISEPGLLRFTPDETTTVLDPDHNPVEAGSEVIGLLARHGPVPMEYLGDPDRTQQTFPVIDGLRYAIPGDLAMIDASGDIIVLGRGRNVINTGGEKVFAEEVEAHLMAHPAVSESVVVGIPDERWGERIGALVKLHDHLTATAEEIVEHCAAGLARFKLPRHIEFTPTIRHLPTGKLDRRWAADTMSMFLAPTEAN